jgi:mRNA interferase MazF
MKPGDVVLTPIPQADGAIKNRPALILREMPACRDLLVCGISTQLHQEVKGFDELISSSDPDFAASGLKSGFAYKAQLPCSIAEKRCSRFNPLNFA